MSKKIDVVKNAIFYAPQDPTNLAVLIASLITDVATSVELAGVSTVENDPVEGATVVVSSKIYNQYGDIMVGNITYALKAAVEGVSIEDDTVTIAPTVADGTKFIVKGTVGAIVVEHEVTVTVTVTVEG